MRMLYLAVVATLAVTLSGPVAAQSISRPPTRTIQCLEVGGDDIPPVCKVPPSRLDTREDICICPPGGIRVDVPICAKGQTPQADSAKFAAARGKLAADGSLVGDVYEGRPICVAPRRP